MHPMDQITLHITMKNENGAIPPGDSALAFIHHFRLLQ